MSKLALAIPIASLKSNSQETLEDLLDSIVAGGTHEEAEVLCLWDQCPEKMVDYFQSRYSFITSFCNYGNRFNYGKNSNIGLRYAHKVLKLPVAVINMDCLLPPWQYLSQIMGKGLSTPKTVPEFPLQYVDYGSGRREETKNKIAFYAPFFSLELLDEVGYIEEDMVVFSDDSYVAKTLLAGFPVEVVDINVVHKGSHIDQAANGGSFCGTYDGDRLWVDNKRYRHKWKIPDSVSHDQCIPYILEHYSWNREKMRIE